MAAAYQSDTQDHLAAVVKHRKPLSIHLKNQGLVQVNHALLAGVIAEDYDMEPLETYDAQRDNSYSNI